MQLIVSALFSLLIGPLCFKIDQPGPTTTRGSIAYHINVGMGFN